jgi:predicted TIM-barrel fold metal-dependent hydrolase
MMKIDMFTHFAPERLAKELAKYEPKGTDSKRMTGGIETMFNLETRFRIMDKYEGYTQVVSVGGGPVEAVAKGQEAIDLARLANDSVAELTVKYPTRFLAAVGTLPLNDTDASLKEIDRAINDLKLKGFMIHTPLYFLSEGILPPGHGKPLDSPELMPIYAKMAEYDLPIWIHPNPLCDARITEYHGETMAKYYGWQIYGWPYQDTLAQVHIVFGGILEKYPTLKFINHHGGGMVPFLERRLVVSTNMAEMRWGVNVKKGLSKSPRDYFRMFYADTAIGGSTPGLMCAHAFYGTDHMVFGTDMPFDMEIGNEAIRETIQSVERMDIPQADKEAIFETNPKKLLHLL